MCLRSAFITHSCMHHGTRLGNNSVYHNCAARTQNCRHQFLFSTPTARTVTTPRNLSRNAVPDIMIARCKTLLKESIFSIPTRGTFVMHPGICAEYRNAHGCFWPLAQADYKRVGMTLLRVDKGVDTGSVYGYYTCDFDESTDSHAQIQHRVVF